jgi:endogenous inhibitor of DNA gyrase (YacG/DUF329 family)
MPLYTKKCTICNNDFNTNRSHTLFCSTKCASKDKYEKNKLRYERVCECCGIVFNSPKKDTRFCSPACINTSTKKHEDIENKCLECGNLFTVSYIKRERKFCSRSCATINLNNNRTEETNKKISDTHKERYLNGTNIHPFLGKNLTEEHKQSISSSRISKGSSVGEKNPMYGKNHTSTTREKISSTRSTRMINGDYNSWFCKGTYRSTKINKDIYFKSSWEKSVLEYLDNQEDVVFFMYEPFSISFYYNENKRHYIPDLLITYKDGTQRLVEIKPSYYVDAEINKAKFESAKKYCNDKGIIFEVWTEKTIDNLFIKE